MRVRPARTEDAFAVAEIHDQGIQARSATFETVLRSVADRRGVIETAADRYPILVAEADDGDILGWAALSEHSTRTCYRGVAECSIHVEAHHRGRRVGSALMMSLITEASRLGYWKLVSQVFVSNEVGRALCLRAGFREVGVLERHARLDRRWMDVLLVERLIPENQH